jgi:hypothetical protein
MLSAEQINAIGELVVIAGKSPSSGADGMMRAAQAIVWLQQEAQIVAGTMSPPPIPLPEDNGEPSSTVSTSPKKRKKGDGKDDTFDLHGSSNT